MQIILKSLKDGSTSAQVTPDTPIIELKQKVERDLKIAAAQQKLILLGSPLQDDKKVSDYPKLKEGSKVYVVVKKPPSFQELLRKLLRKYYSEEQSKIIVDRFMKDFKGKVERWSLDDLERIAKANCT